MYRDELKKTETITVKMDENMKEKIVKIARLRKWSISQTCYEIMKEYLEKGQSPTG